LPAHVGRLPAAVVAAAATLWMPRRQLVEINGGTRRIALTSTNSSSRAARTSQLVGTRFRVGSHAGFASVDSMALDPSKVPQPLAPLLPLAEKWGIGDDIDREAAVSAASLQELESLVRSVDDIRDEDLYGWLTGPEADNPAPSEEYVTITCLTMAADSARLELARLRARR
jgi:hypothetical protein